MKAEASRDKGLRTWDPGRREGRQEEALRMLRMQARFQRGCDLQGGRASQPDEGSRDSRVEAGTLLFPLATGVSFHIDSVDEQGELFTIFFVLHHLH